MGCNLASKNRCTGCSACANACPKNCIQLMEDETGFFNPEINREKCTQCMACVNVCPVLNGYISDNNKVPNIYGAKCNDEKIRFKSTSGGIFATLAKEIFHENGIVVGAIYESPFLVKHEIAYDESQLESLLQSKYVQSELDFIFKKVKEKLEEGIKVLFCGAPCQVAGLYSYLHKSYDNLITCDFVCYGMNSPKAYREWLKEFETDSLKVKRVWFKYKGNGWYNSPLCTKIDFNDDTSIVLNKDNNYFMLGYVFESLYIRQCCGDCQYKGLPRIADITLGDFWGIDSNLDDNKGTSIIMINNDKGNYLFNSIKPDIEYWETNLNTIIKGNHMINDSVNINLKSEDFLRELEYQSFSDLYKKYTSNNKNNIKW